MENALGIAEERELAGAAVGFGRGGQFVFGGSAEIVGADDDVAEGVAVVLTRGEVGANQASGIRADTAFFGSGELREGLRETQIRAAVGLDGFGQGLEGGERRLLVGLSRGLVPFGFEGRKIEEKQADGENFPLAVLAYHAHKDVMSIGRIGIGSFAKVDGEESEIVAKVGAADLELGGAIGSFTAD